MHAESTFSEYRVWAWEERMLRKMTLGAIEEDVVAKARLDFE